MNIFGAYWLKFWTKSKIPLAGTYARSLLLKKLHSYLAFWPVVNAMGSIKIYSEDTKKLNKREILKPKCAANASEI